MGAQIAEFVRLAAMTNGSSEGISASA